jgi:hypothetical protein
MRTSWNGVLRALTLLVILALVGQPTVFADDTDGPFGPPESRIRPPSGVSSQSRIKPPGGITSLSRIRPPSGEPTEDSRIKPPSGTTAQARILPPSGEPTDNARIGPPGGVPTPEPSWYELLINWLAAHGRIHPPTG